MTRLRIHDAHATTTKVPQARPNTAVSTLPDPQTRR
jgi:hypothetical protein